MGRILTEEDVEFAVRGGSIYACGGGGWQSHGRELGKLAVKIGRPELVDVAEVPSDAWIATAAAIGAPGDQSDWQMLGIDYVKAVQLVQEELGERIHGLIIGQNGMSSTVNAWLPSAILSTKVVDAVGDIRAHPTGDMGSLGLASLPDQMIQSAVGGDRKNNAYIEMVVRGATARISPVLRKASDESGGFIASCRNPVPCSYVREHAVIGGISQALKLGQVIKKMESKGPSYVIDAICEKIEAEILFSGKISEINLKYINSAFDVGVIEITDGKKRILLHVMNEYMAIQDSEGEFLSKYPDVITTLGEDANPVSAGHLRIGIDIYVLRVSKSKFPLSSGVLDPNVYPYVENVLGFNLSDYALGKYEI